MPALTTNVQSLTFLKLATFEVAQPRAIGDEKGRMILVGSSSLSRID